MNPRIDVLKGLIKKGQGLVKPYDFQITLQQLNFGFDAETSRRFSDMVQDFSLPSRTYSKQPVYYGGPLKNFPYIATYNGEINFNLIMTKKDEIYKKLHTWHQSVINPTNNIVSYQSDYLCEQMQISFNFERTGKDGESIQETGMVYTITDVWPESLTEIPMSNTAQNDYVRFGVVFSFRKWSTDPNGFNDITSQVNAGNDFPF